MIVAIFHIVEVFYERCVFSPVFELFHVNSCIKVIASIFGVSI